MISLPSFSQHYDTLTLHFDFNKSALRTKDAEAIQQLVQAKGGSIQEVKLYGHCDRIGNHRYNDSLSLARANAVKEYVGTIQVNQPFVITAEGKGKRYPLNNNATAALRDKNRRVDMLVRTNEATLQNNGNGLPRKDETVYRQLTDSASKKGKTIILKNMNFYGGRHIPLPPSLPVLDELLKAMQDNPKLAIEINGYVCCTWDDADGLDFDLRTENLSEERAKYIYQYLVNHGIDAARMSYQGHGSADKLFPYERDEEEKSANRRVEVKITGK